MEEIDKYIKLFLEGSLSPEDQVVLRRWIRHNVQNRKYFYDAVVIWKATAIETNEAEFDVDRALKRFLDNTKESRQVLFYRRMLRLATIAGAVLLCVIVSLSFLGQWNKSGRSLPEEHTEYIVEVPGGAKSKVIFPDQSIVWLNAGSKIIYPSNFAKESRTLSLTGEGYFEVFPNKDLPFIIKTEKLSIEVLGTKFNLKSYKEDSEIRVILKEGEVKIGDFQTHTGPVVITPNQRFIYQKARHVIRVDSVDVRHLDDWRNGSMFFDKMPLEEIAKELSRQYDIPIKIENNRLKDIVYYSDFKENIPIEKVLKILSAGGKFSYEVKPGIIRIYN